MSNRIISHVTHPAFSRAARVVTLALSVFALAACQSEIDDVERSPEQEAPQTGTVASPLV